MKKIYYFLTPHHFIFPEAIRNKSNDLLKYPKLFKEINYTLESFMRIDH